MEKWAYSKIIFYFNLLNLKNQKINIKKDILKTVIIAFLIGSIATLPIVLSELFIVNEIELFNGKNIIRWFIYSFVMIVSIFFEFYYLYIIGFKIISKIIFIESNKLYDIQNNSKFISSIAKSSIEYPEKDIIVCGMDTSKYKNKKRMLIITLLYKLKIMLSNFILKLILKKILSRTSFRGLGSYIAIPITGIWDAFILNKIIKEVRFKVRVKIKMLYLLDNFKIKDFEPLIKILSFRILLFSEYNYNLEFLLLSILKIKGIKENNIRFKEDYLFNFFNSNLLKKEEKEIAIVLFSFKEKKFNKVEKDFLIKNDILDVTKLKQKELKIGY